MMLFRGVEATEEDFETADVDDLEARVAIVDNLEAREDLDEAVAVDNLEAREADFFKTPSMISMKRLWKISPIQAVSQQF